MKVLMIDQIAKVNYKYTYSLANALCRDGIELKVIIDDKTDNNNNLFEFVNLFNTDNKSIGKKKKLDNYIRSYMDIEKIIKNGNYDIIHAQWLIFSPVDYFYINKIIKKYNIKFIMTVHDILPFNKKFYDTYFHRKIYSLAASIVLQAENNIARFSELFPEMADKAVMIPHGHFLEYGEYVDKKKAREKLNIPENSFVFLFFGQIKKVKGVGILLEAFSRVVEKYGNFLLIIAGSVWKDDFSQYQKIIDEKHLARYVRTDIHYIPDHEVKYYYGSADCCVLPYLDVYQSGVVQLTYAHMKPAIATNLGAFREVIIDGETGFLCEPNNPEKLADSMEEAFEKRSSLKMMAKAGYEYIADKYSWEKIAREIKKLYEN